MGFWDGVDEELKRIVAQIEGDEPIGVSYGNSGPTQDLSATSVEWQESVLEDTKWWQEPNSRGIDVEMTFVRETEDGEIRTTVRSDQAIYLSARVTIVLNGNVVLANHFHGDDGWNHHGSHSSVRYVQQWIRRQILPELRAEKRRREVEANRRAAERAEIDAEKERLRRKYMP